MVIDSSGELAFIDEFGDIDEFVAWFCSNIKSIPRNTIRPLLESRLILHIRDYCLSYGFYIDTWSSDNMIALRRVSDNRIHADCVWKKKCYD